MRDGFSVCSHNVPSRIKFQASPKYRNVIRVITSKNHIIYLHCGRAISNHYVKYELILLEYMSSTGDVAGSISTVSN